MKQESLSVFMPFYNEEELVGESARTCHSYLQDLDRDFELILVNDGSTDRTGEIIDGLEKELERVRAIHHEENLGYGRALATGFSESKNPLVFYTDGDMQFDIEELGSLLEEVERYDLVVGYREERREGFRRRLTSRVFNGLARLLLPIDERDIDCGFKLIRREVLEDIDLETERTVDAELLAKTASEGYSVEEIPVSHRERPSGESEASGAFGVGPGLVYKSIEELLQIRRDIS